LSLGTDKDDPLAAVVLTLVGFGHVSPNVVGPIDIAGSEETHFRRPAPRLALEADHVRYDTGQVGQRGFDRRITDRRNRLRLAGLTSTPTQARECGQRLVYLGPDKLFGHSPTEHAANAANVLVNCRYRQISIDHLVADRLQREWPKLGSRLARIERPDRPQRRSDGTPFPRRPTVLDVSATSVLQIADAQLSHRQAGDRNVEWLPTTGQPLADQSVIFALARLCAVRPEVEITAT